MIRNIYDENSMPLEPRPLKVVARKNSPLSNIWEKTVVVPLAMLASVCNYCCKKLSGEGMKAVGPVAHTVKRGGLTMILFPGEALCPMLLLPARWP